MKKRVIISTGQGRLHLIESAKSLLQIGVDVSVITGWIPPVKLPDFIYSILSKLSGRKNLKAGFEKRRIPHLDSSHVHTCSTAEFFIQFLFILSKFKIIKRSSAAVIGWRFFGFQSRRYLRDVEIFHVRSGAGQGGAIKKARSLGMKIVVDHSIAHPQEVYDQLLKANGGIDNGIVITPKNKFWQLVLKDCDEADILLVNSGYVKDSFVKNGYPEDKIEVAELGIREDFVNLKNDWQIQGEIKLLFTGGFGQRKGGNIIIEMAEKLINRNVPFQLNIVGAFLGDIILPDWFKNSSQIHLHGAVPQDDLKNFFINSDIYIFPSYSEGAAQSLKEAMAAGLPVIATEQSGVKIEDKINGMLVEDHSSEQLVDAVLLLSQDINLRKTIAQNAINEIRANGRWEDYALKLERIYSKL